MLSEDAQQRGMGARVTFPEWAEQQKHQEPILKTSPCGRRLSNHDQAIAFVHQEFTLQGLPGCFLQHPFEALLGIGSRKGGRVLDKTDPHTYCILI